MMKNKKAGFADYPINFIWAALFLIMIVMFAINLGSEYGLSSTDLIDERINISSLEREINDTAYTKSLVMKNTTLADEPDTSGLFNTVAVLKSIWGTIVSAVTIPIAFFNIITNLVINILGIPSVVFYSITAIFLISIVFAAWRVAVTGK